MGQISIPLVNTMKGNGMLIKEVVGVACITVMGLYMRGNGMMTNEMATGCLD